MFNFKVILFLLVPSTQKATCRQSRNPCNFNNIKRRVIVRTSPSGTAYTNLHIWTVGIPLIYFPILNFVAPSIYDNFGTTQRECKHVRRIIWLCNILLKRFLIMFPYIYRSKKISHTKIHEDWSIMCMNLKTKC